MAEIYSAMNYHGVAVGPFDLAAGLDFIKETGRAGIPWISANLYDSSGELVFNPYMTVQAGELAVCVVGLTAPGAPEADAFEVRESVGELGRLMPLITPGHDLIIVLSNLSYEKNLELAKRFPEIKVVVGADRRKGNMTPQRSKDAVIMQTAGQGKYLGVLSVSWANAPWKIDQTNKLSQLKNHLKSTDRQLNRINAENDKSSLDYKNKILVLKRNKDSLQTEISSIEMAQKDEKAGFSRSSFHSDIIALDRSIPEDRRISAIVASIKNRINRYKTGQAAAQNAQ